MKLNRTQTVVVSGVLILPASFLCGAGILGLGFGLQSANAVLSDLMGRSLIKFLFNPGMILGGPLLAIVLNVPKTCSLTVAVEHGELMVAFAVKRLLMHLIPIVISVGLLALVLIYGFVENFQIVGRH